MGALWVNADADAEAAWDQAAADKGVLLLLGDTAHARGSERERLFATCLQGGCALLQRGEKLRQHLACRLVAGWQPAWPSTPAIAACRRQRAIAERHF